MVAAPNPLAPVEAPRLTTLDEALGRVVQAATPLPAERVLLEDAGDRIVARAIVANRDAPARDVSAMDGYAVRDADLPGEWNVLHVTGESYPGGVQSTALARATAARVFTGAPIPPGADRVVLQEDVHRDGARVLIPRADSGKRHIRRKGSDFGEGDVMVPAGCRLGPAQLVAAAAADHGQVEVFARPRLVILATGDELRAPGDTGMAGSIPDSVSLAIAQAGRRSGALVTGIRRLSDTLEDLRAAASEAIRIADVVVVIGGASVGERDFSRSMFAHEDLETLFSKVAMRPGKPVWFGKAGSTYLLGVPGNPTAALFAARLFLIPLLAGLSGLDPSQSLAWHKRSLTHSLEATEQWDCLIGACAQGGGVRPLANRDSSAQKTLAEVGLLIRRPPHCPAAAAAEQVDVLEFEPPESRFARN